MFAAHHRARRVISIALASLLLSLSFHIQHSWAASLTAMSDTLSNNHISVSSTHTVAFTTATTSTVLSMQFQFTTTSGGSTKPAGLNLSSATLGTVSNFGSGWSIDTSSASSGILGITRSAGGGTSISSGTAGSVDLQNITNSALADCTSTSGLYDTCYVTVTTYSDAAYSSSVDSGTTTYTVIEDPNLTFEVRSVGSGQTHNGITTSLASTSTSLPFSNLHSGSVVYLAHELYIITNAPHGYKIYAYLSANFTGTYVSDTISPFGATNAAWNTPQLWSSPNGTSANSNTGWFGANTTDTSITGWSSASQKFGPFSTVKHLVAQSTGPARGGTSVYLSYALETNLLQPSDLYTGNVIYDVEANY